MGFRIDEIAMAKTRIAQLRTLSVRPIARYSPFDSAPLTVRPFSAFDPRSLSRAAGVSVQVAARVISAARKLAPRVPSDLAGLGLRPRDVQRLSSVGLFADDGRLLILDVGPVGGRVMSNRPFR